ncbi:hypothetical protein BGX27_007599 [Mortierella sp. AM989]|nr:hypothetical protein BGX27_007599 [Mortierella sp. AM989]
MSQQSLHERREPEVLIVGAGIGGLALAILLEQLNFPYHIFERASEVKPLGSAMSFGGNILTALEQLGIYEEFMEIAKPYVEINFFNSKAKKIAVFDLAEHKKACGYYNVTFSRPKFYDILRRRVPNHKISFKKKILRSEEKDGKVIVHCSDNTSYAGDILVGADGAYSGVRQSLYRRMELKGILPKEDAEGFTIDYTTIVGVATPSNPEKYPQLQEEYSSFNQVLYKGGSNCFVITLPNNQISWGFGVQLPSTSLKEMHFRNSEWGPETNDSSLNDFRDFPCPIGGKMGEIFDDTPKHLISKVFLEEKIFTTWHYGRTVLLGDGAINVLQDAISLANCLYSMTDYSSKSIEGAFVEYRRQRYDRANAAYKLSVVSSKIMNGQRVTERLLRKIVLKYIPRWAQKSGMWKAAAYRPQVAWLPLVENRGSGSVLPQEGKRYDTVNV